MDAASISRMRERRKTRQSKPESAASAVVAGRAEVAAPLAGRVDEMHRLYDVLSPSETQYCQFIGIYGEPGIGKTRLLEELAGIARSNSARIIWVCATEYERHTPFSILREIVDGYVRTAGRDSFNGVKPAELNALRTVCPAISVETAARDGADELATLRRHRIHRAASALLEMLGTTSASVVVLLDDVHWVDEDSIELLDHLLRRPPKGPLVIAATLRPRQAPARLLRAIADAERRSTAQTIELAPLRSAEADQLLAHWHLPRRLRDTLMAAGGGNPLYLHALAGSQADRPPGQPAPDLSEDLLDIELPRFAHAVLSAEINALSPEHRTIAAAAALAGETFDPDLVAGVSQVPPGEVFVALDAMAERDLIRPVRGGFQYRHPLLRVVAYQTLNAVWRLAAHRAADAVLETRGASPAIRASHIEHYAVRGERKAVDILVAAATRALPTTPARAAHWLTVALRLLPYGDQSTRERLDLQILLARAFTVCGRLHEARKLLGEISQWLPGDLAEQRLQSAVLYATVDRLLGRHAEARARLIGELDALPDQHSFEGAALCLELAVLHPGRLDADRDWAKNAGDIAEKLGNRCLLVNALSADVATRVATGTFTEQTFTLADDVSAKVDALPDVDLRHNLEATWLLGWTEIALERFERAQRHLARGLQLARASGQQHVITYLHSGQGTAYAVLGQLDAAAACFDEAWHAAESADSDKLRTLALTQRAWVASWQGRLSEATAMAEDAVRRATPEMEWCQVIAYAALARVRLYSGDPAGCVELLLKAGGGPELPLLAVARSFWYHLLATAEATRGALTAAHDWADRAQAAANSRLLLPQAFAHLARANASATGDPIGAAVAATHAAALFDQVGARLHAGRAHLCAAVALGSAGQFDQARDIFARARALLGGCGATFYHAQAVREERRMNSRRPRRARAALPATDARIGRRRAGLTDRELEVARLVTAGLTNHQIAQRLFVSPRTVEAHLHRVFAKLGVKNRAAVAGVLAGIDAEAQLRR